MAENPVEMKSTVGLTGLTMNAMALIAPGAFSEVEVASRPSLCRASQYAKSTEIRISVIAVDKFK